ncbi:hypothetical protein [Micromonospora sp. WMMD712]|uniref:hypothetical protein n=1 Tax=Micromonospora sp. WMMD712 TaxID=3016096 RepID=UPI00249BB179|nr:hypothetical protein [Micromonospora sp. WMMD712]WFE58628.1 hypothetical protein O7633_18035 [Micromonospora sp. WMMD712]
MKTSRLTALVTILIGLPVGCSGVTGRPADEAGLVARLPGPITLITTSGANSAVVSSGREIWWIGPEEKVVGVPLSSVFPRGGDPVVAPGPTLPKQVTLTEAGGILAVSGNLWTARLDEVRRYDSRRAVADPGVAPMARIPLSPAAVSEHGNSTDIPMLAAFGSVWVLTLANGGPGQEVVRIDSNKNEIVARISVSGRRLEGNGGSLVANSRHLFVLSDGKIFKIDPGRNAVEGEFVANIPSLPGELPGRINSVAALEDTLVAFGATYNSALGSDRYSLTRIDPEKLYPVDQHGFDFEGAAMQVSEGIVIGDRAILAPASQGIFRITIPAPGVTHVELKIQPFLPPRSLPEYLCNSQTGISYVSTSNGVVWAVDRNNGIWALDPKQDRIPVSSHQEGSEDCPEEDPAGD